jgi:hypothetical protein
MRSRPGLAALRLVAGCSGGGDDDLAPDGGADAPAMGNPPPTAGDLRAVVASCDMMIGGPFSPDSSDPSVIPICGLPGAVFWKADLDVDCDGLMSAECNPMTDPWYMDATAATDSMGLPLDAAHLPYVVIPGKSTRFDYKAAGLAMGSVFAVVYKDTVSYGVAGDIGPTALIGEASYAMAKSLGINPDPHYGGTDDEVIYIAFTGSDAIAKPIEDHDRAVSIGLEYATALVGK